MRRQIRRMEISARTLCSILESILVEAHAKLEVFPAVRETFVLTVCGRFGIAVDPNTKTLLKKERMEEEQTKKEFVNIGEESSSSISSSSSSKPTAAEPKKTFVKGEFN